MGRTPGGFWGSGRGSPLDDGKSLKEMKAEGEEGTGKPRGYRCELSKNGRQSRQFALLVRLPFRRCWRSRQTYYSQRRPRAGVEPSARATDSLASVAFSDFILAQAHWPMWLEERRSSRQGTGKGGVGHPSRRLRLLMRIEE
jgi:hypothetical protein